MERFVIKGGKPLSGEIEVRGSKNAASKLMIASLLTSEECLIENMPFSADVDITRELCATVGSEISFDNYHRCVIKTLQINNALVSELSRKNRIPILALGPLLHRNGQAEVPVLGGCPIGHRPINLHLESLTKMGIRIERRPYSYFAEAPHGIKGTEIELSYPSVGATENILLTSVRAEGTTIIRGAAVEPEIINLIEMLKQMGAQIFYDNSSRYMEINGVRNLHGVKIRVIPDRNEIVSFAAAALATDGDILIRHIQEEYLISFLDVIRKMGGSFEKTRDGIRFFGKKPYRAVQIETASHPGFMTDWQQPVSVILTEATGESIIHETVYEDRFGYMKDLRAMGAAVHVTDECLGDPCRFQNQTFNHSVRIIGPTALRGRELEMTDIRAGMAHIIAALSAEGESLISGIEHVDRGYETIDERLRVLGADINRVNS